MYAFFSSIADLRPIFKKDRNTRNCGIQNRDRIHVLEAHREANWSPIKRARLLIVITLSTMIQPSASLVHETEDDRHFDRPSNYVCCHFSLYGTLISGPLNNPFQSTRIAHCVTHFLHIYELLVDRHLNSKQASIMETIETSNTPQDRFTSLFNPSIDNSICPRCAIMWLRNNITDDDEKRSFLLLFFSDKYRLDRSMDVDIFIAFRRVNEWLIEEDDVVTDCIMAEL